MEERPLPRSRSQIILLVWIRDKSIVAGHHGDIEMDKVAEERRSVRAWVSRGHYTVLALPHIQGLAYYLHFSFQWLSTFQ